MLSFLEYIIIFVSIIFGYVASEFFNGWGRFLRNRREIEVHWDYVALTIFFFIMFLDFWWLSYTWYTKVVLNIFSLISFLVTPLIYFFYSILLFPHEKDMDGFNSRNHFLKNNVALYTCFIILMSISAINEYFFKTNTFYSQENLIRLSAVGICVVFMIFRKRIILLKVLVISSFVLLFMNLLLNR